MKIVAIKAIAPYLDDDFDIDEDHQCRHEVRLSKEDEFESLLDTISVE